MRDVRAIFWTAHSSSWARSSVFCCSFLPHVVLPALLFHTQTEFLPSAHLSLKLNSKSLCKQPAPPFVSPWLNDPRRMQRNRGKKRYISFGLRVKRMGVEWVKVSRQWRQKCHPLRQKRQHCGTALSSGFPHGYVKIFGQHELSLKPSYKPISLISKKIRY